MPYKSGEEFARKHNKKLKGAGANKARKVAEAMMSKGASEGMAIATGNKAGNKMMGYAEGGLVPLPKYKKVRGTGAAVRGTNTRSE